MNINRIKGQIKSYGHKMELVLGRKPGIWDWAKFGVGGYWTTSYTGLQ